MEGWEEAASSRCTISGYRESPREAGRPSVDRGPGFTYYPPIASTEVHVCWEKSRVSGPDEALRSLSV